MISESMWSGLPMGVYISNYSAGALRRYDYMQI